MFIYVILDYRENAYVTYVIIIIIIWWYARRA